MLYNFFSCHLLDYDRKDCITFMIAISYTLTQVKKVEERRGRASLVKGSRYDQHQSKLRSLIPGHRKQVISYYHNFIVVDSSSRLLWESPYCISYSKFILKLSSRTIWDRVHEDWWGEYHGQSRYQLHARPRLIYAVDSSFRPCNGSKFYTNCNKSLFQWKCKSGACWNAA